MLPKREQTDNDDLKLWVTVLIIVTLGAAIYSYFDSQAEEVQQRTTFGWHTYTTDNGVLRVYARNVAYDDCAAEDDTYDILQKESGEFLLIDRVKGQIVRIWTCYEAVDTEGLDRAAHAKVQTWREIDPEFAKTAARNITEIK